MNNLTRLLTATTNSKSPVVQDLRQEVARYFNEQERYVSGLEMENMGLIKEVERLRQVERVARGAARHEKVMRSIYLNELK